MGSEFFYHAIYCFLLSIVLGLITFRIGVSGHWDEGLQFLGCGPGTGPGLLGARLATQQDVSGG